MTRVKRSYVARRRRKKILKLARGYYGDRSKTYTAAKISVFRALQHAYHGRKRKKRDFRRLWIMRINALSRECGMPYNKFIFGLKKAGVTIDRKMLAEMAAVDPESFRKLADLSKSALNQ